MTTELAKRDEGKAPVKIRDGRLSPETLEEAWRVAQALVRGSAIPGGCNSTEEVLIAVLAGMDVGLSPLQAVQNIFVVNKRPTIWGDAMLGLVEQSGKLEDIEETTEGDGKDMVATCRVVKRGRKTPIARRFSMAEAVTAGLAGKGPWRSYPARMLQLRARSFALRDAFPEVLKGLRTTEEMQDASSVREAEKSDRATAVVLDLEQPALPAPVEAVDGPELEPEFVEAVGPGMDEPPPAGLYEAPKPSGWGDPPKRNPATHPAHWRAKLLDHASEWVAENPDMAAGVGSLELLAAFEDKEHAPPPGVPIAEATPWYKRWADKAASGDIDWSKYL